MRVTTIEYERLQALSKYENHRGKVIMELEDGDDPNAAMLYAKEFLEFHLRPPEQLQQPQQPGS